MITSEAQKSLRQTPTMMSRFVRLEGGPFDGGRVLADTVLTLTFAYAGGGHLYHQREDSLLDFAYVGETELRAHTAAEQPVPDPRRSPALRWRSEIYPEAFGDRVPLRIRLLVTVEPTLPAAWVHEPVVMAGAEIEVWVNSHGAVIGLLPDDECLALKLDTFEVIAWHPVVAPTG